MSSAVRPLAGATWAVARMGAAMHYAVARILHGEGKLDALYTDFYVGDIGTDFFSWVPMSLRPAAIRKVLGRTSDGLPRSRVRSYPWFGLSYYAAQVLAKGPEDKSATFYRAGKKFCELVGRDGLGSATALYTFTTAALELLQVARSKNIFTVVEQTIAPRAMEEDLLSEEDRRFRGWEKSRFRGPSTEALIEREKHEWDLADLIVCGSEFVRDGIGRYGGPLEKCVVVPYGVDETFSCSPRRPHDGPLRVLSVGELGLRKGAPYAADVAARLGPAAEFRWVGPVALEQVGRDRVARHIDVRGPVPRKDIHDHFAWADVFFLPSVCEGSATVIYEALMAGLPVVSTPNSGSLVRDEMNGYVVPNRDVEAMAERLSRLAASPDLLSGMQRAVVANADTASLGAYRKRLLEALSIEASV